MNPVPKKNISKIVADIKYPQLESKIRQSYFVSATISRQSSEPASKAKKNVIKLLIAPIFISLIAAIFAFNAFNFKDKVLASAEIIYEEAMAAKQSASELKTEKTVASLKIIDKEIKDVGDKAESSGLLGLSSLIGKIIPAFKNIPASINTTSSLSGKMLEIAESLDILKNSGFQMAMNGKGETLINLLDKLNGDITSVESLSADLKNQTWDLQSLNPKLASLSDIISSNYISLDSNLYQIREFVGALSSLLKSENARILLMFQNPSEIRPGGGFVGSFGYITIDKGAIKEIKIDDIYNADRQLTINLVPPRELQNITRAWGARDANWFFDFPSSAKKITYLLENSKLFLDQNAKFAGAIAINTNVMADLLDIIGPIEIPSYNLTVDSKNFLEEIQYEVESGRDKKPGQNPKKVLSVLAPIIIEEISNFTEQQKEKFSQTIKEQIKEKEIMAYAGDWKLENFFINNGIAGEVMALPEDFSGDYLAVVDANIYGGKSDAFMSQKISLNSKLLSSGKILNNLSVTRTHSGQNEEDWWYRSDNKNYLKIFVPPKSNLLSVKGDISPATYSDAIKKYSGISYNYAKSKYQYDSDLQMIEKSSSLLSQFNVSAGQESGKKFFGMWFNTPAGETRVLETSYETSSGPIPENGKSFTFVFEKQSGVNSSLEYSISAPDGYRWKENNESVFKFNSKKISSREIIELTLLKI
ncbi:MAG: DUF4012 domain-containing protein [Candidatus Pacebacteria bacterium]|nr:DUF4012 domain-containing protein [Candidatus Paceibacterota bacterium]